MVRRILLGLGGTPFSPVATQCAIELAQTHGAELAGITVVDVVRLRDVGRSTPGQGAYTRRIGEERVRITEARVEKAIEQFVAACSDAGIKYRVERESGDAFDLMVSHARYHDLIVFGLRGLFEYGVVRNPEDALIRLIGQGVRPILAVASTHRPIQRVLVAYSGSMESAQAIKRFVQMRLWCNAALEIVCCGRGQLEAANLLDDAATYCRAHGFEPGVKYIEGSAREHLLAYAKECQADLIVMGNSIRSLLLRRLLGDTMLHTIQNADRPLLLAQ